MTNLSVKCLSVFIRLQTFTFQVVVPLSCQTKYNLIIIHQLIQYNIFFRATLLEELPVQPYRFSFISLREPLHKEKCWLTSVRLDQESLKQKEHYPQCFSLRHCVTIAVFCPYVVYMIFKWVLFQGVVLRSGLYTIYCGGVKTSSQNILVHYTKISFFDGDFERYRRKII